MRAGRGVLVATGLWLCLSALPLAAQSGAGLRICNKDENGAAYLVAMLQRWPFVFDEKWEASGWYQIDAGDCQRWSRGNVNTLFLLSVTRRTDRGREILDYGVSDIPETHWESGAYGMEQFYCVSEEPFKRAADDRFAYRTCQSGEYKQLFNLHIFVEHNSSYTLNLR